MDLNELLQSKQEEFELILNQAKVEERQLTQEEDVKVEGLKEEVRNLKEQIEAQNEAQRKQEAYDEAKQEIEEAIRALSVIDAEEALNKAYVELDAAWQRLWEAVKEEEEAKRKEDIKGLIREVLNEPTQRNERLVLEQEVVVERQAKEGFEAELATERQAKEDLTAELATERQAKENIEKELEEVKRELNDKNNTNQMEELLIKAVREQIESQQRGEKIVARAAADGDTTAMANAIPNYVKELDIMGYEPMFEQMGCDILRGVSGTYTLPYEDPIHGAKLAELATATGDTVTPSGVLISPNRFSVRKTFTVETLASAGNAFYKKVLGDMVKGCDRAITKEVYTKVLAGATEVATGAITKAGFDALMGQPEIEYEGAFISARATFFEAKGVAIDAGSGRFLVEKASGNVLGKGTVYDGTPYFYSNLFEDGADKQYVAYGDLSKIHVADYGKIEIIVDKFTAAADGKVIITINKLADVALINPVAFSKTPDLDVA